MSDNDTYNTAVRNIIFIQVAPNESDLKENYLEVDSLEQCRINNKSWFYNFGKQKLHIHYDNYNPWWIFYSTLIGFIEGYSDKLVYIDNIYYAPLIKSIPSIAQQQDLIKYGEMATINGGMVFNNVEGNFDYLINDNIFGNTLNLYYLDDKIANPLITDLMQIGQFFIDDYDLNLQEAEIRIQDKRLSKEADIPTEIFNATDYRYLNDDFQGEVVPIIYGSPRRSEAIPVDSEGSGNVTFRQALILTALGTVQVLDNDVWTTVVPVSSDLPNGSFVLNDSDCRNGGTPTGDVFDCRVLASTGIIITYASDVIKDLNSRYLDIEYNTTNYDTTEWELEEISLTTISVVFNEQLKLTQAIKQIQDGANIGFRYETNPVGKRTIRINDYDRTKTFDIYYEDILNNSLLPVKTDKEYVSSVLDVKYSKDFLSGKYLTVRNTDFQESVNANYNIENITPVKTFLDNASDADDLATWYLTRFSVIPKIAEITVMGETFLNMRIYDIGNIDLTTGPLDIDERIPARPYYGRWKTQILSIDPDIKLLNNKITAILIEKI